MGIHPPIFSVIEAFAPSLMYAFSNKKSLVYAFEYALHGEAHFRGQSKYPIDSSPCGTH